jgi:hypothetical protein
VQDTKLFETILGIQAPWHIARVALDTSGERVDLSAEHADDTADAAPSATGSWSGATTPTSGCGGTSTRASTRPCSTRACRASTVRRTACAVGVGRSGTVLRAPLRVGQVYT